jgi:hypothetical protein
MDMSHIKSRNKFEFHEVVRLTPHFDIPEVFWNTWGQIAGIAYDDECDEWGYSVIIFDDDMLVWDLPESSIEKALDKPRQRPGHPQPLPPDAGVCGEQPDPL